MEQCFILMASPPWDLDFQFSPVAVFIGENAEKRANHHMDELRALQPSIGGHLYEVRSAPIHSVIAT
jgi:hypothetical protein